MCVCARFGLAHAPSIALRVECECLQHLPPHVTQQRRPHGSRPSASTCLGSARLGSLRRPRGPRSRHRPLSSSSWAHSSSFWAPCSIRAASASRLWVGWIRVGTGARVVHGRVGHPVATHAPLAVCGRRSGWSGWSAILETSGVVVAAARRWCSARTTVLPALPTIHGPVGWPVCQSTRVLPDVLLLRPHLLPPVLLLLLCSLTTLSLRRPTIPHIA